jgi:bifunctional DNase/RNase
MPQRRTRHAARQKEAYMISVDVLTLIMSPMPGPSILVLQPTSELGKKSNGRVIPIWVGVSEATQLGIALEHVRFARPMTHDLFLDALTNLDSVVESVVIDDVQGPTFFAKLKLQHHGRTITLDARPSDAISLAIREQAPLYMTESVLEKASFPYLFNEGNDEEEIEEFRDFISHIAPEDFNPSEDGGASGTFRDVNNLADLNIFTPDEDRRFEGEQPKDADDK